MAYRSDELTLCLYLWPWIGLFLIGLDDDLAHFTNTKLLYRRCSLLAVLIFIVSLGRLLQSANALHFDELCLFRSTQLPL